MRESPFGFEYSWEDLRPVRPLSVIVLVAQLVGAGVSFAVGHFPTWFENVWFGGALTTFPGFAVGLIVQRAINPSSLVENRVMVRRMGLVSVVVSLAAFMVPMGVLSAA